MELRGIQAVQFVKPGEARRTNSVSETCLDLEMVAHSDGGDFAQHRRHAEPDDSFDDVEEFEVIEVSAPETDNPSQTALNHVDVIA